MSKRDRELAYYDGIDDFVPSAVKISQQTVTVDYNQIWTDNGVDYYAEASTLGLAPGNWPAIITVENMPDLGTADFGRIDPSGVTEAVKYQHGSLLLVVFND
jgi:hypothetical protein